MIRYYQSVLWIPVYFYLQHTRLLEEKLTKTLGMSAGLPLALGVRDTIDLKPRLALHTNYARFPCWSFWHQISGGSRVTTYLSRVKLPFPLRAIMTLLVEEDDAEGRKLQNYHIEEVFHFARMMNLPVIFIYLESNESSQAAYLHELKNMSNGVNYHILVGEKDSHENIADELSTVLSKYYDCVSWNKNVSDGEIFINSLGNIVIPKSTLGIGGSKNVQYILEIGGGLLDQNIDFTLWTSFVNVSKKSNPETVIKDHLMYNDIPIEVSVSDDNDKISGYYYIECKGAVYDSNISPDGAISLQEFQNGLNSKNTRYVYVSKSNNELDSVADIQIAISKLSEIS